ncbi:ABC transporter transmembrane domain-containing protein [Alphaproteobacteria bacterium]|nr:ABC transporter transmembrane domain-containing protein [Alphaproteobacteria bacterium]
MLTIMAALSFPVLYIFYELPKQIINGAIQGNPEEFPQRAELFGINLGFEVGHVNWLIILCLIFLGLVIINQAFKYVINVYKGLTGERMLRRLRYDLYTRVLRFPKSTFKNTSQGEIIPMITAEVEPLGGFIGDAFAQPLFQGGQLLVILGFLFAQNPFMAAAAVALYPIQLYIIPKLQMKVNLLGKDRVRRVRALSDKIGETVQGVEEVHVHDTSTKERAEFSYQLGGIFDVRYKIYRQKFFIKFVNNFIQQLGPFFFYSIGGYLVINGQLEVGTLMAAIAAHKDLASPWKELLGYYQKQADSKIKYDQVISQFEPVDMIDESIQSTEPDSNTKFEGEFSATNIVLHDDQDTAVVDGANINFNLSESVALIGSPGSGREDLSMLLANLLQPSSGSINIGGNDINNAPESITGRRMSYVGSGGYVFSSTLAENLFYGLKHKQLGPNENKEDAKNFEAMISSAEASGNSTDDPNAHWIDYESAGAKDHDSLVDRALEVLKLTDLTNDVYQLGLRGTIDSKSSPDLALTFLKARSKLMEKIENETNLKTLIEFFDINSYNTNATVGENLVFGNPNNESINMNKLGENPYIIEVLEKSNLTEKMIATGYQVAATMVELFADLPADHEFFQQFSFISSEELPDYQAILSRVSKENLDELKPEEKSKLIGLPFLLVPARHRLGIVTEEFQAEIMKARKVFSESLPDNLKDGIEFYDSQSFINGVNLQDNILFGKIAYGEAGATKKVGKILSDIVQETGLEKDIVSVGLKFNVGIAGSRLTLAQRQKLILARSLIKRPDVLIISDGLSSLESSAIAELMIKLLDAMENKCLIWVVPTVSMSKKFDRVVAMRRGQVVKSGSYQELGGSDDNLVKLIEDKVD